jgi:hypothetical protein
MRKRPACLFYFLDKTARRFRKRDVLTAKAQRTQRFNCCKGCETGFPFAAFAPLRLKKLRPSPLKECNRDSLTDRARRSRATSRELPFGVVPDLRAGLRAGCRLSAQPA